MSDYKLYKKYMGCLGSIVGFFCCSYVRIQTSQLGFLQKFGKFTKTLQPGLHYYNPLTESVRRVQLKTQVIDMPNQTVYTKDNISVQIDSNNLSLQSNLRSSGYFKKSYIVDFCHHENNLRIILQDLLIKRTQLNNRISEIVEESAQKWGVHMQQIILKDMKLTNQLSANLSVVAKTKRQMESQLISARADLECAKLYREASDIMDIKAAVQIRFLQTLEEMNMMQSKKTIVIPLKHEYEVQ